MIINYYTVYCHVVLFHVVLIGKILLPDHIERSISLVNMVHFHLSLSGCGMGSLEPCTHVILMPESHIITTRNFIIQMLPPPMKR